MAVTPAVLKAEEGAQLRVRRVSQSVQEIADAFGDLAGMGFQREMAGIEDAML